MENKLNKDVLFRLWIAQLYADHRDICWRYKVKLTLPIIEITSAKTYWGKWDKNNRTISISEKLIFNYSWDVVLEILKHEMAHQFVNEQLNIYDGHGELFKMTCEKLGVLDEFASASGDIKIIDQRDKRTTSQNKNILEKIRKLLSLAKSSNEHESFLAMKKANELIKKYNIERIEKKESSSYSYIVINHKKKRVENYQRKICLILMDYFFVKPVYCNIYDATDLCEYKVIELLGTHENVLIAEYVYYFLLNQIDFLWKRYKKEKKCLAAKKRSYFLGILNGFEKKLNDLEKNYKNKTSANTFTQTTSALICIKDIELTKFIKKRFPRLRSKYCQGTFIDPSVYNAGEKQGKKINLYQSIINEDGNKGKLLAYG